MRALITRILPAAGRRILLNEHDAIHSEGKLVDLDLG